MLRTTRWTLPLFVTVLTTLPLLAQAPQDTPAHWEQRLRADYRIDEIRLPPDLDGPFFLIGDLTPGAGAVLRPGRDRGIFRSIAAAFLRDNRELLDVRDPTVDLQETGIAIDHQQRAHVSYQRSIEGLPLEDSEVIVHIGPDGSIVAVNGRLSPVTPALERAVANTISLGLVSEAAAHESVLWDLGVSRREPVTVRFLHSELVATRKPPYVLWKIEAVIDPEGERWRYALDATDGEPVSKRLDVHTSSPNTSEEGWLAAAIRTADLVVLAEVVETPGAHRSADGPQSLRVVEPWKGAIAAGDLLQVGDPGATAPLDGTVRELPALVASERYLLFLRRQPGGGLYIPIGGTELNQHVDHRLRTPSGESLRSLRQRILDAVSEHGPVTEANAPAVPNEVVEEIVETLPAAEPASAPSPTADPDDKPAIADNKTAISEPLVTQTLLYEDFEGAFPGSWLVFDNDGSSNGEVYWDDTSYRSDSGSWSAWCADGGANGSSPGGSYSNNMQSWMVRGPFDLSAATDATFSFRYWNDSELSFDYFKYLVSINGSNFYGYQVSGNSGGWSSRAVDLTAVPTLGDVTGQPAVWIAFVFVSDSTITREGAYVDEVRFEQTLPEPADLSVELIDGPAGTFEPGDPISVHNVVENVGGETSSGYRITFYASTNTIISTGDHMIGFVDRSGLVPGGIHNFNTSGNLPVDLADGSYYLGAILTVSDADSSNNTNYDPTPFTVQAAVAADLDLQLVDVPSGTYSPNGPISIHNVTQNVGSATSSGYRITFYASTNNIISAADHELGFVNRSGLAPGASHNATTSGNLPANLAAGTYYIGAILTISDANSSNNSNVDPTPIDVTTESPGPKIGTGEGVVGNVENHVDTYFDDGTFGSAGDYVMVDVTRRSNQNVHGHGGQMGSGSTIETRLPDAGLPLASDGDNAWTATSQEISVDAQVGAGEVYDYWLAELALNSYNGGGTSMASVAGLDGGDSSSCPNNAFWNGLRVNYCVGSGIPALVGAKDVVAHEWGHALTDDAPGARRSELVYALESGALNEAFSDWIGNAFEHWLGESNWTLGEGVFILRDMADPNSHQQPDTVGGLHWFDLDGCTPECDRTDPDYNDCCGVHTNSGVPNKMFYLLSEGTDAESGGSFNGVVVEGLGIETTMEIGFDANVNCWLANETFVGARQCMIVSAGAHGTNAADQVRNAWAAVGVGDPADSASDLIASVISVSDVTPATGQTFTINAEVENQGNANSPSTTLRYLRSTNSAISLADTQLSTDGVSGLSPGGTSTESDAVSIATAGTYWVGVCVDSVSGESITSNNCSSGVQVVVSGTCSAQDGENLVLSDDTVAGILLFEVCDTLTVGPNYHVAGPNGDLILRAGSEVVFRDGFSIGTDGKLSVEIDPSL